MGSLENQELGCQPLGKAAKAERTKERAKNGPKAGPRVSFGPRKKSGVEVRTKLAYQVRKHKIELEWDQERY